MLTVAFAPLVCSLKPALATSADDPAYKAFVSVSRFLTGRDALDPSLASRTYEALSKEDAGFGRQVQALERLISDRKPEPLQLQKVLDTDKSLLAPLPRRIATAWYLGVVGKGDQARCIAFEDNLTNVIVGDQLRPPSYCFGPYGSWAQKPM